jgi:uncharacterized protein (TIGR00255 family)
MIRSMTGYGQSERDTPAGQLRLEVKTVNHRFFNPNLKTPPGFDRFESDLTEVLRRRLFRGHVSVYLSIDRRSAERAGAPRVDLAKAREYREALEAIRSELSLPGEVELAHIARFSDLFRPPEADDSPDVEVDVLREMADEAVQAVLRLREAEGVRLEADLCERLEAMSTQLARIAELAPQRLLRERDRLRQAVRELSEQVDIDEERMAREIAYLADKWDINEELVRFRSHVELFREALAGDGSESVGKRLSFLVQELHREANTIGSKANDTGITEASLALKEEIERLREQVENVE